MRRLILPGIGLLLIGLVTQAAVMAREPAGQDEAGWFLLTEGPMLKLAYGVPDSDQLGLMFTCTPGDSRITVYGDVEPDLDSLTPISTGPVETDPLSQGDVWGMSLSADDPGLWLLVDKGYLPVRTDLGAVRVKASRTERQLINRFLQTCARQIA